MCLVSRRIRAALDTAALDGSIVVLTGPRVNTRGMQGEDLREGVIACAKHFLGYAQTEAGQNMAAVAVGPRELHDVYARPFEAAIRLAGLGGVMASYSDTRACRSTPRGRS